MNKKGLVFTIMTILMISSIVLSGCGAPATAEVIKETVVVPQSVVETVVVKETVTVKETLPPTEVPAAEKLTVSWGTIGYKDFAEDFFLDLIARYEAANPNIKIEWIDLPGQYREWFLTSLVGGTLPDVVDMHRVFGLADWAEMGALANIDELIPADQKARYPEGIWNGYTFKGVNYCIPWWGSGRGMWTNPDLLEQAGIDVNANPPTTYKELFALGKIVHEKTGEYGLGFYISDWMMTGMFIQEGVELFNADGTPAINSPRAKEVLTMFVNAYKDGVFPPEAVSVSEDTNIYENVNWFVAGRTAFDVSGSTVSAFFEGMDFEPGMLPAVIGTSGKGPEYGGHCLTITQQSEHKKEALDFALFVSGDENQLLWAKRHTSLPTSIKVSEDPYFATVPADATVGQKQRLLEIQQIPTMFAIPLMPGWSEMASIMKEEVANAFLEEITVDQALLNIEQRWSEVLAR